MKRAILINIGGAMFALGLTLAGAEGDWFPYINIFGGVLFFAAALILIFDSARHRGGSNGPLVPPAPGVHDG